MAKTPDKKPASEGKTNKAFGNTQRGEKDIQVNRIKEIVCTSCGHPIDIRRMRPLQESECTKCKTVFQVPCQISQYILVKRVASGAMGSVYVAFDETLNRQVALKVVNASAGKNDDLYQDALRESRVLASLNHPNIAQIYSMSEDMGQPFITMEMIDGGSFLDLIKKGQQLKDTAQQEMAEDQFWLAEDDPRFEKHTEDGRVRETVAIDVILGAARGLSYAYNMGYLHRDIKPGNLLLNRENKTKIIDFGLAERESRQVEGKVMGSPYYMPPEIARGKKADCRADIYSLGASLWHMLAGTPPFKAPSPKEVILLRFKEPPGDLEKLYGVHPFASDLVAWMMNLEVDARPEGYPELIEVLLKAYERIAGAPYKGVN